MLIILLKIVSWDVKGVNNAVKRQKVMSYLQQFKVDIASLHVALLKLNWAGQVFHSRFNAKARGTQSLLHKHFYLNFFSP